MISLSSDFPAEAYSKACRLIDEFDALAVEYDMLLDTQRVMLAKGNDEGIVYHTTRGDAIARRVVAQSQQMHAIRNALETNLYAGPRAEELRDRLNRAFHRAGTLGDAAIRFGAECAARRAMAEEGLRSGNPTRLSRGGQAYRALSARPTTLDIAI